MASDVTTKDVTVWYCRDSGESQGYFQGDSDTSEEDEDEGASKPLVGSQDTSSHYLDVSSAYTRPTGGPGTRSPRATSYYKAPGSGIDLEKGDYVPNRTSLYQFFQRTQSAEAKAYEKLMLSMHAFSNCTNDAIEMLLPLLKALKECPPTELNEKFRAILSCLAESRAKEKGASGEIDLESYGQQREAFYGRSFSGVEEGYYDRVVQAVAQVLETGKSPADNEQVVVTYISLAEVRKKRDDCNPALVGCHDLFNEKFPTKNALRSAVPAYEREWYAALSYRILAGHDGQSYKELFTRVVGLASDKKAIKHFVALSKKKDVHHLLIDGDCKPRLTRPPVLHSASMIEEDYDMTESASLDFWIEEMARLCRAAMEWTPESQDKALKDLVARIRFIFVHTAPNEDGNTVMSEWLELAIYIALGFEGVSHKNEEQGALAALSAASFADFRLGYDKLIQLGHNTHRPPSVS